FDAAGQKQEQTQFDILYFHEAWQRDAAFLLLNGKWMFAFWSILGDDFHVARWNIAHFPIDLREIPQRMRQLLQSLARCLKREMSRATSFKRNAGKRDGTYNPARCRHITDRSDRFFARLLGRKEVWTEVELLYVQIVKTEIAAGKPIGTSKRRVMECRNAVD